MRHIVHIIMSLLVLGRITSAQNAIQHVLFIGCKAEGIPGISATYEALLRDRLGTVPGTSIISYVTTGQIKEILEFDRYPAIIPENLDKLRGTIPDSTMIIWSNVRSLAIEPDCGLLSECDITGELTVRHSVFMFIERHPLFDGEIRSISKLAKKGIAILPRTKTEHIDITDRVKLTNELVNDNLERTISILASLFGARLPAQPVEVEAEDAPSAGPSISDVFSVPSVEAAKIDYSTPEPAASAQEKSKNVTTKKNQKTNTK